MKFLIDENVNIGAIQPLRTVFVAHQFSTVREEALSGLSDVKLFEEMRRRGFTALITRDGNQVRDPSERQALKKCGLHWIGVATPKPNGIKGMALETAGLVASLPYVLEGLEPNTAPTAFHLQGIPREPRQRVRAELL